MLTRPLAAMVALLVAGAALWPGTAAKAAEGDLVVVAGTGTKGSSGDSGPATEALLDSPGGVAVAADGTVYISDSGNHRVRAVSPDGTIFTVAGTGEAGTSPVPAAGEAVTGTGADLGSPLSLAVAADGTLYIADVGLRQVFALSPGGELSVLAGTGAEGAAGDGGPAPRVAVGQPRSLAVAPDGTVYIGDVDNQRVRAVAPDGVIATVAGDGGEQLTAAGGAATRIPVRYPNSLAVDDHGTVWIAGGLVLHRLSGDRVATVTRSGRPTGTTWGVSEEPTWPPADQPLGEVTAVGAGHDGIYVIDQREQRVLRLTARNVVETVATLDSLDVPVVGQVAVAESEAVYLVDTNGHRVYRFSPATPPAPPIGDGALTPWWLFAAGGAVVVIVLGSVLVTLRRRRAGHQ